MSDIDYGWTKDLGDTDFDEAVAAVTEALGEEGFGVLTEIDVKKTFKKKLDEDFRNYRIMGACNPNLAWDALNAEPHIGALLPCNVVVQQSEAGDNVQVTILKPEAMFAMVDNEGLESVAEDANASLQRVLESL